MTDPEAVPPTWLTEHPQDRAAFLASVAEAYHQLGGQYGEVVDEGAVESGMDQALRDRGWSITYTDGLPDRRRSVHGGRGEVDQPAAVDLPEGDDV